MHPLHLLHRPLAAVLALALAVPAPILADGLPELGDASAASFSPQDERRIGDRIMAEIRRDPAYFDDPELVAYLNNLGYRLVAASPGARMDFEFFAVKDNSVNAFALPGGYIGVHTGLLLTAQSESELASVLAHEIAHVTQRHIARMVQSQAQQRLTSLAALALAILAARSNPQVANAVSAGAQATAIQSQIDYTRDHEREADRIGLAILDHARFDPRGMPTFFDRMQRAHRYYESAAPAYLRTHPLTFERIADVENRVQSMPYRQIVDSLEFHLLRAKLRAEQDTPREALVHFQAGLEEGKYANEAAQRYGLVRALLRNRQADRAAAELEPLRALAPHNAMVETLAGEVKRAQGDRAATLAHYRGAIRNHPYHRALVYGYGETLLEDRAEAPEALKLLEDQLLHASSDPRLYEMQAKACAMLGRRLQQHRAQAEAYYLRGALPAAVEQLQIAVRSADGDFYQLSSAEARLRELKVLEQEERKAAEKR